MSTLRTRYDRELIASLKKDLLLCLEHRDPKALRILARLKVIGREMQDEALLGYVFYRYAYYYYFTVQDYRRFRQNLQMAITHLLRSDDAEYLASAYNLVAYDAQDQGSYDIAYAYFMMALRTSEHVAGIALPGLVAGSVGRLLTELGFLKEGRTQLRNAVQRLRHFPDMYVFYYNMIISHADVTLASFLMGDARGMDVHLKAIAQLYEEADEAEKELSHTYTLLPGVYLALLKRDAQMLAVSTEKLYTHFSASSTEDLFNLIFEIESLGNALMDREEFMYASRLMEATACMALDENLSVRLRYNALRIRLYELTSDAERLKEALSEEHALYRKQYAERMRNRKYAMEFVDMIQSIAAERNKVSREHDLLARRAFTDALTDLPNRNALDRTLAELFDGARLDDMSFAVGIIDVDQFKAYNDTHGHLAGDVALQRIGAVLKSCAQDERIFCARYGGDEFIVCYIGYTDEAVLQMAQKMHAQISSQEALLGQEVPVAPIRISQGICNAVPAGRQNLWDYFSAADRALYAMKKQDAAKDRIRVVTL